MSVVAVVGAITMVLGATIALTQTDIKRVVAYSTMSQLGYMMMACGLGAYAAGIYHLMTHGAFKALLFLGCGSVIIALHHEQDMRRMGGLKDRLPITYWTFVIGSLCAGRLSANRRVFQQGRHSRLRLGSWTARTGIEYVRCSHGAPHRLLQLPVGLCDLLGSFPGGPTARRTCP
jgi:hypothetical protein